MSENSVPRRRNRPNLRRRLAAKRRRGAFEVPYSIPEEHNQLAVEEETWLHRYLFGDEPLSPLSASDLNIDSLEDVAEYCLSQIGNSEHPGRFPRSACVPPGIHSPDTGVPRPDDRVLFSNSGFISVKRESYAIVTSDVSEDGDTLILDLARVALA